MSYAAELHALRVLRHHIDTLAIAALTGDRLRTRIARSRLRRATLRACSAAGLEGFAATEEVGSLDEDLAAPHLVDLQGRGADLHDTRWGSLHAVRCDLHGANLRRAMFDAVRMTRCDLTRANLTNTSWHRARLLRCSFNRARLVNVALDGARFEDCDFRGAKLSMVHDADEPWSHASFVRCDLRDTHGDFDRLDRALLIDCRMSSLSPPSPRCSHPGPEAWRRA